MTDTKSYTPGAESAARELCRDWTGIPTPADVAEIISRETGDLKLREQNAEMLEALKRVLAVCDPLGTLEITAHARAVIAKVEGH